MLQFTLSNQTYTMPDKLEELSYSSFLKYLKADSDLAKLEVLLNSDLKGLDGSKKTQQEMAGIIPQLDNFNYLIKDFLTNKPLPEETTDVMILGKSIRFDKDLGKLPYWALTKVKSLIKQMGKEPFNEYENYTSLVANYTYSKFEPYNEYKAEEFGEEVINQLPFNHVIKLGDFFFIHAAPLMDAESKLLQTEISIEEEQAGIDVFTKYGELNVLEGLSSGDVTKWELIKGMPFEVVLTKRRLNNEKANYEKKLWEIRSKGK